MVTFDFDRARHVYRLDGSIIPSLSEILRPITERIYSQVPDQDVLEAAKLRGTQAHLDTELFDKGEADEYTSPYAEGWAKFRRSTGFEPTHIEHSTYHTGLKYGTTIDRLGVLPDGTKVLLDIKTGQFSSWHKLQTAGQALALATHGLCRPDVARIGVLLTVEGVKGDYKIVDHDYEGDLEFFRHWTRVQQEKWRYE